MSWDSYVTSVNDHYVKAGGQGAELKIWLGGLDGNPWAANNTLPVTQQEAAYLASVIASGDESQLQAGGLIVGGEKYMFLKRDAKFVYGKKKDTGFVTAAMSQQALIVAFGPEGAQQGQLNTAVGAVVAYLESAGY